MAKKKAITGEILSRYLSSEDLALLTRLSVKEERANSISNSKGYQGMMASSVMPSGFKKNPVKQPTQDQTSKKSTQTESKKRSKKDPDYSSVAPGIVRPLKFFDSVADILGKMYNFMTRKYIQDGKQYKKDKKYRKKLVAIKERNIEELIKLFNGKYKKPIFKDTEKDKSLVSKIIKGAVGLGLLALATKAFASIPDLDKVLPSIPFLNDFLPDFIKEKMPTTGGFSQGTGEISKKNVVRVKEIYSYLTKEKGLSKEQAVGMLANIQSESSFNSGALGDYDKSGQATSGGLFQHHNERFAKMVQSAGPNWQENWKGQVDFALSEKAGKDYTSKKFNTAEEATEDWTKTFEKPANENQQAEIRKGNIPNINKVVEGNEPVLVQKENPKPEVKVQTPPPIVSSTKPPIPNKLNKPVTQKSSSVAVLNNSSITVNGSTNMAISNENTDSYPALIEKQYYSYN